MKFTTPLKRAARSLLGVGVTLAFGAGLALAQGGAPNTMQQLKEALPLEPANGGGAEIVASPRVTFYKTGHQRDCKYVEYRMRFSISAPPGFWDAPGADLILAERQVSFFDQLPDGLKAVNATVSGDIVNVGGGAVVPSFDTNLNPDDTVRFTDARLSAADLDGDGSNTDRAFTVTILAAIDHAKFPAPTVVDNQARVNMQITDMVLSFLSHDPSAPDDGNPFTGDPTPISIDVTNCLPPPPPPPGDDNGPCFIIEEGEVDCDPLGGGAFIYKMPVGPELAGDTIELTSLTPGVTVVPPFQVVPAGGAVLAWTILGASPGDVIQLVVGDVKHVGGPAEGVGLCCAERIEIVIPEDLDCPEDEGEPDLQIRKRADEATCKVDGICDFTIEVKNIGDAPYTGKIVLDEVTTPGNAPVTSGPNVPWSCPPMVSPMSCEHPATTLNPGESVLLKLGFTPGPGWAWNFIRNCAEYDYTASGKDLFGDPTNDRACARIDICLPGDPTCNPPAEDQNPDLGIRKQAKADFCSPDGLCSWLITVYNASLENFSGPVTVIDEFPLGDVNSATFSPTPPWNCAPLAGNRFQCIHPGLDLPVGATAHLQVTSVDNPADYPDDVIENCAEVQSAPGEVLLGNNKSCAEARIPREPDEKPQPPRIRVEKTGDKLCVAGEACEFEITITNDGPGDFDGDMRILDAAGIDGDGPVSGAPITVDPPFGCTPEPAALPINCIASFALGAGESRSHTVTVELPELEPSPNIQGSNLQGRNCVAVIDPDALPNGTVLEENLRGEGDNNDHYDCHEFAIEIEEIAECSPGFVLNADGRCICPEGTSYRSGQCLGDQSTTPVPPRKPEPQSCRLLPGQIRTASGDCACRRGTVLRGGRCVSPPQQVEECRVPGQVRNGRGRCVCPRGTRIIRGACRKPEVTPQRCEIRGQVRNNRGSCVCPRGTRVIRGACRKPEVTPQRCDIRGQVRNNRGSCVCPRGTRIIRGACRKPNTRPQSCRIKGQVRNNRGRCVCPRGTRAIRGVCRKLSAGGGQTIRPNIRPRPRPSIRPNLNVRPNIQNRTILKRRQ